MIPIIPVGNLPSLSHVPLSGSSQTISGLCNPPPLSLYIHIPWCVKKCPYCDFNSHESRTDIPQDAYIEALIADLELSTPLIWGRKIHSVFFGGGTPSLFSAQAIDRILSHVRMLTPLEYGAEITLEANPGTADAANFQGYRDAGVTRLSLGIQSFDSRYLSALGRIHDGKQAHNAAAMAMRIFDAVNLDVMYALPGQSLQDAISDAKRAADMGATHLSFYHLTLEPNTPFHRTPPSLPDDDTSASMQEAIEQLLASHGYQHYETSAFAQPGRQARHNLNYWQFGDYLGIGAGAHSKLSFHDKIIRQSRHKHPNRYLEKLRSAQQSTVDGESIGMQSSPFIDREWQIASNELGFEFMMNALRLTGGVATGLFTQRTGLALAEIEHTMQAAMQRGLLEKNTEFIRPTLLGQRFLNELLGMFLN